MNTFTYEGLETTRMTLTQGQSTLIDDADVDLVSQHRWYAAKTRRGWRVTTNTKNSEGKQRNLLLHRFLMEPEKGLVVDHLNHDALDNRRSNMRVCTYSQNAMNQRSARKSSSKYLGVSWDKGAKKWKASILIQGKKKNLGRFKEEDDAARAFDTAARLHFGEYANPNFAD